MSATPPPTAPAPLPAAGMKRLTVRASAWTIAMGLVSRFLGVIGTLILTHYVAPYDYGEVSAATVIVWTANQFSSFGIGTYVVAHRDAGRDVMFHATFVHVGLGVLAFAIAFAVGGRLGPSFDAPHVGRYLPGMVVALLIERVNFMPERVLVRGMRFGALAVIKGAGEVAYTAASVLAAMRGWGGMAIIAGNLVRSALRLIMLLAHVAWRDWIQPTRLRRSILRDIASFGSAIFVGGVAAFGVRRWDNLIVSSLYGPAVLGTYNLAYNLADIPAVQVGEQISDVLQAAFARLDGGDRTHALLRSTAMVGFIMTPLAVGLGCIAPTLAETFFDRRWAEVGPMLMALSVISFPRPVSGTVTAYLQVKQQPRLAAALDVLTLLLLVAGLFTVGRLGPIWACISVGIVFGFRLLAAAVALKVVAGIPVSRFLGPLLPPVVASVPMIAAVAGVHHALAVVRAAHPAVALVVEIVAGGLAYALAALVFAGAQVRELWGLVQSGLGRLR